MESYFPDNYFRQTRTVLALPSDTPGFLNIDRAIRGSSKIFDQYSQGLGREKEKCKIIFNLEKMDWKWNEDILNHWALLLHAGFELYGIGANSLQPIMGIDEDSIDFLLQKLIPNTLPKQDIISRFLGNLKEEEVLILEIQDLNDVVNQAGFYKLHAPLAEDNTKINHESKSHYFEISNEKGSEVIQYFKKNSIYAGNITKLQLQDCHFEKKEMEQLLALLPQLELLALKNTSFQPFSQSVKLELAALKKLHIEFGGVWDREGQDTIPLADLLNIAPQLQILKLCNISSRRHFKINLLLHNLSSHPHNSLHTLVINRLDLNGSQLSSLLFPSLIVLDLKKSYITGALETKKQLPRLSTMKTEDATFSQIFMCDIFAACSGLKEIRLPKIDVDLDALSSLQTIPTLPYSLEKIVFPNVSHQEVASVCAVLNTLINDKNVFIEIISTKLQETTWNISFTSTPIQLDSPHQKILSYRNCDTTLVKDITSIYLAKINSPEINTLQLRSVGYCSRWNEIEIKNFYTWLYDCKNIHAITYADMVNIPLPIEYLDRITFNFNLSGYELFNSDSFILITPEGICHCEKDSLNNVTIRGVLSNWEARIYDTLPENNAKNTGAITAVNLTRVLQKFSGCQLKTLSLENFVIMGKFSVAPDITVDTLILKNTTFEAASVDEIALNLGAKCKSLEVYSTMIKPFPSPFSFSSVKALKLDIKSWNNDCSYAQFDEMHLQLDGYSDKHGLNPHKGVTSLQIEKFNPAEGAHIFLAFPNLKHLDAKKINWAVSGAIDFYEQKTQIEQITTNTIGALQYPLSVFPHLKKITLRLPDPTLVPENVISTSITICLSSILIDPISVSLKKSDLVALEEIHINANVVPWKPIILQIDKIEEQHKKLPSTCTVYFDHLCQLEGSEADIQAFLENYPNFKFLEELRVGKDISSLQRLGNFDPSNWKNSSFTNDPNFGQMMLVNRLYKYLSILFSPAIADAFMQEKKLDTGICKVVSKWCADTVREKGRPAFEAKWNAIQQWDGKKMPVEGASRDTLKELHWYVENYQHGHSFGELLWEYGANLIKGSYTVANDLEMFLMNINSLDCPILIHNTWHTTCLFFEKGMYYFLDPGFQFGKPIAFDTPEKVAAEIHRTQGNGLLLTADAYGVFSCSAWNPQLADKFCIDGGFRFLPLYDSELMDIGQLNQKACEAIFDISTYNKPFWFHGLSFTFLGGRYLTAFAKMTLLFLKRYIELTNKETLKTKLSEGIKYLTKENKKQLETSLPHAKSTPSLIEIGEWIFNEKPMPVSIEDEIIDMVVRLSIDDELISAEEIKYVWSEEIRVQDAVPKQSEAVSRLLKQKQSERENSNVKKPVKSLSASESQISKIKPTISLTSLFDVWNEKTIQEIRYDTLETFDGYLLAFNAKDILLDMGNNKKLTHYLHHLESLPQAKKRGFFVINEPDDMQCAVRSIVVQKNGSVVVQPAPGGSFYHFLNAHEAPIVVINWHKFNAACPDEAHLKLEQLRKIDGVHFPKNALVLVLHNVETESATLSGNFSSKVFPAHLTVPEVCLPVVVFSENEKIPTITIELFGDVLQEETFLFGQFKYTSSGLQFKPSKLLALLDTNPKALNLVLRNPPNPSDDFYERLYSWISTGRLEHCGRSFDLPKRLNITIQNGYNLAPLVKNRLEVYKGFLMSEDVFILNPTTLSSFFTNYVIDSKTKVTTTLPGFIKAHKGKTLSIAMTRNISLADWAKLLTKAKKANVKLKIKLCHKVTLPQELATLVPVADEHLADPVKLPSVATLMISNDISATSARLEQEKSIDSVVDVSELSVSGISYALFPLTQTDDYQQCLRLEEFRSDIWKLLMQQEKTVLLKGQFSQELGDVLAQLFKPHGGIYHNGAWELPEGKLIVLTDNASVFSYVTNPQVMDVSVRQKLALLQEDAVRLKEKYPEALLATLSFSFLKRLATCKVLPKNPADLLNPYLFPTGFKKDGNFKLARQDYMNAKVERETSFFDALEKGPSMFIAGETGVGKSSFMQTLAQRKDIQVFFGDISGCLKALKAGPYEKDGVKILYFIVFFDESNLRNTDFSFVQDMYNVNPSIFHEMQLHEMQLHASDPCLPSVGIACAGNAKQYGGGRNVPKLFMDHPNAIVFEDIGNASLYYEALLPILEGIKKPKAVARIFLKTYQWIKEMDYQAVSARELEMMGYLFAVQASIEDPAIRAKFCAYQIANLLLKSSLVSRFNTWFSSEFGSVSVPQQSLPNTIGRLVKGFPNKKKLLLVPADEKVYSLLESFMNVRSFKQKIKEGKGSYGGLSGFFLEGDNEYKLTFVREYLFEVGLVERSLDAEALSEFNYLEAKKNLQMIPAQHFYYLSANVNLEMSMLMLYRAFHEGAVIILDKISKVQFKQLERSLNAFSMGEDLEGKRALVAGFSFIVITDNPNDISLAVQRRCLHVPFPPYNEAEMTSKLSYKTNCSPDEAQIYVGVFHEYQQRATTDSSLRKMPFKYFMREVKNNFFTIPQDHAVNFKEAAVSNSKGKCKVD